VQALELPYPVEKIRNQADYDTVVCKGGSRLRNLKTKQTETVFTLTDAVFDNGWVDVEDREKAPSLAAGREGFMPAGAKDIYPALGISTDKQDNMQYSWIQARTGKGAGSTKFAYGDIRKGTPYGTTRATYENSVNPKSGMIVCESNHGPAYMLRERAGDSGVVAPAPPMSKLSDLLWVQWYFKVLQIGDRALLR